MTRELKIATLTWNLAGKAPSEDVNLASMLLPTDALPDLYVVGLQEMVNLDILGSLACTKDIERMNGWETIITRSLNFKAS
jgi:synaptojanin